VSINSWAKGGETGHDNRRSSPYRPTPVSRLPSPVARDELAVLGRRWTFLAFLGARWPTALSSLVTVAARGERLTQRSSYIHHG
jgi:hypothetical protein